MLAYLHYGTRRARAGVLARLVTVALAVTSSAALAQSPPPDGANQPAAPPPADPSGTAGSPPAAAPSGSANPQGGAAPGAGLASKGAITGYAYKPSGPPAYSSDAPVRRAHLAHHANEAVATFTGFEMLADGGSRLFVQLSRQVDVSQEKADVPQKGEPPARAPRKGKRAHAAAQPGVVSRLKFVLKGTEVVHFNNERALVTVHFNTPVVRASLVPAGRNLDLVVDLRADVAPQMKVVAAKDNGAMLQVDFPAGSFLPADATASPAPAASSSSPAGANDSAETQ